jgi:hypothetical protein
VRELDADLGAEEVASVVFADGFLRGYDVVELLCAD